MVPRIVIDTNVFVAALLSEAGDNRLVIRSCLQGRALPLFGAALFHEYEDVMARPALMKKSPIAATDRQALFEALLSTSDWVRIYYLWRPNLPDEGDNHLIDLAVAGGGNMIVTNNVRDVRGGELAFPTLKFLTPAEFLTNL